MRIAAQTLDYLESNAKPIIFPGDEFLSSFAKSESPTPVLDNVAENNITEEIQDLQEVVDIEEDDEEDIEGIAEAQLYASILSDQEKRKLDKIQAQATKDAEKERKRVEKEMAKAIKEKEKESRKNGRIVTADMPLEMPLHST